MAIVSVRISCPAINEYWHLSRRIDADELGAFVLAGDEVYRHRVELDTEFLEKPSHAWIAWGCIRSGSWAMLPRLSLGGRAGPFTAHRHDLRAG